MLNLFYFLGPYFRDECGILQYLSIHFGYKIGGIIADHKDAGSFCTFNGWGDEGVFLVPLIADHAANFLDSFWIELEREFPLFLKRHYARVDCCHLRGGK